MLLTVPEEKDLIRHLAAFTDEIIASASGETERIITEADCGICCELGNAEALAGGRVALAAAKRTWSMHASP